MVDTFLVPQKTTISAKGDGPAVEVSGAVTRVLLAALNITRVIEQESLDVSVWGSADGANFGSQPLAAFPQKFYRGTHPLLLDLRATPQIKFLRAHWEAARWGRGVETPMFEFEVALKEVPAEMLALPNGAQASAAQR
jgi:hypothetical protein